MPLANRPVRQVHGSFHPFRWIALFLIPSTVLLAEIEPVEITLQPSRTRAIAVRAPNPSWLVTIHMGSGEPTGAIAADPDRPLPLAGFDKTTRLCIFASPSDSTTKITGWSGKFPARSAGKLTIREPGNSRPCRFNNWTYQIGRKVLPLALPTVSFQGNPPIQGSPSWIPREKSSD